MIESGCQFAERCLRGPKSRAGRSVQSAAALALCTLLAASGCSSSGDRKEFELVSFEPVMTVAVAPAMNFSGSLEFDPIRVSDLMASELSSVPGIGVVGVNRVLAVLAEQGVAQIQSPEHAVDVCSRIGADRIIVFAVTEYDPYAPTVGISAQLYGRRPPVTALDPVVTSRMARPFSISSQERNAPWAIVQRTFNGVHEAVHDEVRDYAKSRTEDDSPFGWRRYLASQQLYLRFCTFAIARELMQQQSQAYAPGEGVVVQESRT